jgi:two-component system, cell cycle sensor histidine kinase and response regulator CckA
MGALDQPEARLRDEVGRLRERVAELDEELRQRTASGEDSFALALQRVVEALRLNQNRLELAHAAAGIAWWDFDIATNQTRCSREYGPLYGLPPGDFAPSHDGWLQLIHSEDRPRINELVMRDLAQEHEVTAEFRVVWPDGTIHWLFSRGRIIRDSQGTATRVVGVNMDITGQKNAEQALRDNEKRFREMAATAPVMIFATGADGLATFFNKRWLDFTGRTMDEELGNGWAESIHPEDKVRILTSISESFDRRRYCQLEYRLRRADGEYRCVLCNGVPRFERDGSFAGYLGGLTDITDLKRSHEAALARQKLESIGVLASGIAHDFNNLLGGILADAELLQTELANNSAAREGVDRIKLITTRASQIVRQLMAYAGQDDAALEPVDLSTMVAEMMEFVKVSISKRTVLQLDLPASLPALQANAAQLRQVLLNLIVNASEALANREGTVSVSVSHVRLSPNFDPDLKAGEYIRLEVSDSGSGISPEIQTRIFDPFFTTKGAGRGLGLAAVQGIMRNHGGAVRLVSAPGQGSRFEILLPCSSSLAGAQGVSKAADPVSEVAREAATVLMVEDEPALRYPVAKILRNRGFQVIEAADGRAAVDLFQGREAEIDVVLLDMSLPFLSGSEVLRELRQTHPAVRVVLTSAYGEESVMESIDGGRPWAFIRKPYSAKDLAELLWKASRSAVEE